MSNTRGLSMPDGFLLEWFLPACHLMSSTTPGKPNEACSGGKGWCDLSQTCCRFISKGFVVSMCRLDPDNQRIKKSSTHQMPQTQESNQSSRISALRMHGVNWCWIVSVGENIRDKDFKPGLSKEIQSENKSFSPSKQNFKMVSRGWILQASTMLLWAQWN